MRVSSRSWGVLGWLRTGGAGRRRADRARIVADLERALSDSVGVDGLLGRIADRMVPGFADGCQVDWRESDGSIRRLLTRHWDRAIQDRMEVYERLFRSRGDDRGGPIRAIRGGGSRLHHWIGDDDLERGVADPEQRAMLRSIGVRSAIIATMTAGGRVVGALTLIRSDHRRPFDDDDRAAAEDLAARAGLVIDHARLVEAGEQAAEGRRAVEAKLQADARRQDEFLAMLSHELRNPLSAITNAVEVARQIDDDEARDWSNGVIDRQVRQLSRMVDDLLDVSRITRGKVALQLRPVDAREAIASAVETARPILEGRRHRLSVSVPSARLPVRADAVRLEQVVVNLLSNAARYTSDGGDIDLSAGCRNGQVEIRVTDNGQGIAADKLPEIFELFAQGERTLARSEGGLGIGLTVARSLVELHGGRIAARSDGPGLGSAFVVTIPIDPEAVIEPLSERPAPSRLASVGRRILIVDDNEDTARGLARLLEWLGHEVDLAFDGRSAIEAAITRHPRVILLDIGLPGMNGYEVARRLRDQLADVQPPPLIIAVTGYGRADDRRRALEAGFDHHFVKPVDQDALLRVMAEPT